MKYRLVRNELGEFRVEKWIYVGWDNRGWVKATRWAGEAEAEKEFNKLVLFDSVEQKRKNVIVIREGDSHTPCHLIEGFDL